MLLTVGLWRYESSSEITMMGAAASAVLRGGCLMLRPCRKVVGARGGMLSRTLAMSWGAPTGKARLLHVAD
jgi:hypothetical protein